MNVAPFSPRLQKGAIVSLDPLGGVPSLVVFQYNPETVTRTLTPQMTGGQSGGIAGVAEALRLTGPPQETIKLDVRIDATDQLEKGDPLAGSLGIHPQLAALELLLYPGSPSVIANEVLLRVGVIEAVPPEAPLTVLVWGPARVVPVRLSEFSITEEMFDPDLNPIHAKVSLGFRVLNYRDLGLVSPGGGLFMAHQVTKEGLARLNLVERVSSILSSLSF